MKRLAVVALLLASLAAGCTSKSATANVQLSIAPTRALLDTPVTVTVTGLRPGEHVTLSASATDAENVAWRSSATFVASPTGIVTTNQRPVSGSYDDTDPMGLFDRMKPVPDRPDDVLFYPATPDVHIKVTVSVGGRQVAGADVQRVDPLATGVRIDRYRPASGGLFANVYLPRRTHVRRPAVLLFGGSEGGLSGTFEASLLAAHGYPAMALAYFDAAGLPSHLEQIPLEYFVKALHVLRGEPGVDPHRILTWGVSRGSEAALLLGADFPRLVHGVIATVPSSVANVGIPDHKRPAWTLSGRPVPYAPAYEYGYPVPSDGRGVIPVERITGPVVLVCGGEDNLWPSCGYSDAIAQRMKARGRGSQVRELTYAMAGHAVGGILPYVATASANYSAGEDLGGTVAADVLGRIDAWHHILSMLASLR